MSNTPEPLFLEGYTPIMLAFIAGAKFKVVEDLWWDMIIKPGTYSLTERQVKAHEYKAHYWRCRSYLRQCGVDSFLGAAAICDQGSFGP